MRTARIRLDQFDTTYYHLINRVAGDPKYFPFGDVEKEYMFKLLERLNGFYRVDVISFVVMSNHIHLICAAEPGLPSLDEVKRRWRAFNGPDVHEPLWETPGTYESVATRMRDISCLMKDLQQRFTQWFNRTRPSKRRGFLWSGRFKSNILEKGEALWRCLKYVENNPVRAKICGRAEDYRFSTSGRLHGSGRHPFSESFQKHAQNVSWRARVRLGRHAGRRRIERGHGYPSGRSRPERHRTRYMRLASRPARVQGSGPFSRGGYATGPTAP